MPTAYKRSNLAGIFHQGRGTRIGFVFVGAALSNKISPGDFEWSKSGLNDLAAFLITNLLGRYSRRGSRLLLSAQFYLLRPCSRRLLLPAQFSTNSSGLCLPHPSMVCYFLISIRPSMAGIRAPPRAAQYESKGSTPSLRSMLREMGLGITTVFRLDLTWTGYSGK